MEITELMIGDIVQYLDGKKLITVVVVKVDGSGNVVRLKQKNGHRFNTTIDFLRPIPISPEILEKSGFKKFDFQHIEGQHQWSWWFNSQTSVSLWCRELKDDTKDGWMIRIDSSSLSLCKIVNAVHELQHTFSICKINKQISLP